MPSTLRACGIAFVVSVACIDAVQAGLLRTSGRGTLSRNFQQAFYFVDNSDLNEVGIEAGDGFFFDPGIVDSAIFRGVGGGGRGIGAVPNACIDGYTRDDVNAAIDDVVFELNNLDFDADPDGAEARARELEDRLSQLEGPNPFPGEPCVWEFEEGESLFTFGFFSLFFDTPGVTYDVDWSISGNGVSALLDGAINEAGNLPTEDPEVTVNRGWVTLDAPPPLGLTPGEYRISVSVRLLSDTGAFFWENDDPNDRVGLRRICQENPEFTAFFENDANFDDFGNIRPGVVEPPFEFCGFNSVDLETSGIYDFDLRPAPTSFFSESEILRIVAASPGPDDDPTAVPAPPTLAALLAGLLFLTGRRRSRTH